MEGVFGLELGEGVKRTGEMRSGERDFGGGGEGEGRRIGLKERVGDGDVEGLGVRTLVNTRLSGESSRCLIELSRDKT